ncbi:MAG: zinc ribbon domain-containing protein [Lachnospiraceae bacterium]|nr:zinc ribbon domain-containing protein [Lachnospiraceae bacterium]
MAFCSNCGKEIPDGAAVCPSCGATLSSAAEASSPVIEPWDHSADYDAQDISDNKVYALSAYLFSILGVILCNILGKSSPYAQFHAREALKLDVVVLVVYLLTFLLCWTCIVPVAGTILLLILTVVRIISIVQVCKGLAKEPWLIRSIGALH